MRRSGEGLRFAIDWGSRKKRVPSGFSFADRGMALRACVAMVDSPERAPLVIRDTVTGEDHCEVWRDRRSHHVMVRWIDDSGPSETVDYDKTYSGVLRVFGRLQDDTVAAL